MKKLIIINGTMGVGKTTVCKELYKHLNDSVWLDGDWCWMMNPFVVNEENKAMVLDNINHILGNFLQNSSYKYVIFNWVIHNDEIFDLVLDKIKELDFKLYKITLICSEKSLQDRMRLDGRSEEGIMQSIERLKLYESMNTIKLDTSCISIPETVQKVMEIVAD